MSFSNQCLTDDQTRQSDGNLTGSDINITGSLILSQQSAGKSGHSVCHTQSNGNGKYRTDGGSSYHKGIVTGCPDRKSQSRSKKPDQDNCHDQDYDQNSNNFIPVSTNFVFCQCENCIVGKQIDGG